MPGLDQGANDQLDFATRFWRSPATIDDAPITLSASSLDDRAFRLLADNIPTLCWIASGDGYIVWYNRRWHEYCGTTPEEMEGWGWQTVHDPVLLPSVLSRWTDSIASGAPFEMTFPLRGADGVFRPFLTRIQPVRNASGQLVLWFGVNTEVSAQQAAEQALRLERDRHRSMLENMTEGFVLLDADFRVVDINAEGLRLEHRRREDIVGRSHWDVWPGTAESELGRLYKQAMLERVPVGLEHRFVWPDGRISWLEMRAFPSSDGLAIFYGDVTSRREASDALRESEARFRTVAETMPGFVWTADAAGGLDYTSPNWHAYSGTDPSRSEGAGWATFVHPDDQQSAFERWGRAVATAEPYETEFRLRRHDGMYRWWLARARTTPRLPDVARRWIGTCTDIDDMVAARDTLARSSEELERLVAERTAERDRLWRSSQDILIAINNAGEIVSINPAATAILGFAAEEFIGRTVLHFVIAEDQGLTGDALAQAANGVLPITENRCRHKDGSYRWVSWVAASEGDLIFATGRHVTAEKQAGEALKLAESRIRSVFDTTDQFQGFLTPEGVLLDSNPASLAAIAAVPEDVVGRLYWETPWFTGTEGMPGFIQAGVARAAGGELVQQEISLDLPSGRKSFEFSMRPVTDPSGEVVGIVPEAVETTERRLAESALRQSQKMEAVGQLTGGIAHDFNNMLAVVIGSLDLLVRRGSVAEPKAQRYVAAAVEGARRAASLTQRLLVFSRQQPLQPQTIDPNRLVAGMSDLLRHSLGAEIRLETGLADDVWMTHADPNQLENAILNLAVNARDAMPEGGRLTIETQNVELDGRYAAAEAGVAPGQYVLIAVTDTGSGMPADAVAKVFDPFFTTKDVGKGTGLGLSQVYGFVKQSGGHVKLYSELGHGTTVKIYLPQLQDAEPPVQETPPPAELPLGTMQELVLVVDDENSVRRFSAEALGELGYSVIEANGADAALALLAARPEIALMFSDIVMPEVNGVRLAEQARRIRPDLKVLFTTGYTRSAIVHNGVLDAGVDLIGKPFTVGELAVKVRAVLDR